MNRFRTRAIKMMALFFLITTFIFQNVALASPTPVQIAIQNKGSFAYKATPIVLNVKGTDDGMTWYDIHSTDVTWTSSNPSIATVSNGVVTFTGASGDVTITADVGGKTDSISTTVTATPTIIGSFSYSSSPVQLQFVDKYTDGSTKPITGVIWTSSNPNVATVSSSGLVTFRNKQGDVTITAQNAAKTKTASVSTTVPFKSYKINQTNLNYTSMPNPIQLTLSGVNYDNTLVPITSGVTWSVSDTKIATIDSSGKLTFTGMNGSVTITALYLGNSTSVVATLNMPKTLTAIEIDNSSTFAYSGTPVQLNVTGVYSDNTKAAITSGLVWSSSNTNVATVSNTGVVTFTGKNGDVTIKAQYGSLSATVSTTVNITVNSLVIQSTGTFQYSSSPVTLKAMDGATVVTNASWSSSDPSIATVSGGVVTFTGKNGTVTIYASYGDKTANISTTVNVAVSSIVINGTLSYRTTPLQLSATITLPDGKKQTITKAAWTSHNTSVATVSDTGVVTFTGNNGPLTISVTYGNQTASVYGNIVNPNQITSLEIDQPLYYSTTPITLTLTGTLQNGTKKAIPASSAVWTSSDIAIATVYNGVVYFTGKNGPVTISATYNNKVAIKYVNVNSTIQLSALRINQTLSYSPTPVTLTLTGTLITGQNITVTSGDAVWSSSDPTIATVNGGVVTFTGKNGPVTITAYYGDKSASVSTNVLNTVTSIKINETLSYSLYPVTLTLTGTFANGVYQNITNATWTSSNPAVAIVSNGVVTFTGKSGSVTITATYGGKSASVSTTVAPTQLGNPFKSNILDKTAIENNILLKIRSTPALTSIPNYADTAAHWANREIKIAKKLNLVLGYSDNTFRPDKQVTRAEFVVMVSKMFNILPNNYAANPFTDISDHYAKGYILSLNHLGVIGGYSDRTFKPDDNITRAEVVTILSKLIDVNQVPTRTSVNFTDTRQHWAASAISQIASTGIISGRGNGQFAPDDKTTRAEAVSLLLRTLSLDPTIKTSLDAL